MSTPKTAAIVGCSVGGLLAAGAIAPFFDRVMVFESDPETFAEGEKKGVSQRFHLHLLMNAGRLTIEELFPGFSAALEAKGSQVVDFVNEAEAILDSSVEIPRRGRRETAIKSYMQHRNVVDEVLRELTKKLYPNVTIAFNTTVVRMGMSSDGRVSSVIVVPTGSREDAVPSTLERVQDVDFVVDASGRYSKFTDKYAAARNETVINMCYSTMLFRKGAKALVDAPSKGFAIAPSPWEPRGVGIIEINDGLVIATAAGYHGQGPAGVKTVEEWYDFVGKSLTCGARAIEFLRQRDVEPVYERPRPFFYKTMFCLDFALAKLPANLVFLGDSACSLDPVLAHGMSKAAFQARELRESTRRRVVAGTLATEHPQKAIMNAINNPHHLALFMNWQFEGVAGYRGNSLRNNALFRWFFRLGTRLAQIDHRIHEDFCAVFHLERTPAVAVVRLLPRILYHHLWFIVYEIVRRIITGADFSRAPILAG